MTDFDFPVLANAVAQLAGLFAGLAFTVLVLYLTQNNMPGHVNVHIGVASSLTVAWLALVFNAIYFAIITGTTTPEASILALAHIPTLATSLLLLLLAIALASSSISYMAHARMLCKIMTVVVGPVIICGFFTLGVLVLAKDDCAGCGFFGTNPWYESPTLWGVVIMLAVSAATLWFVCLPDKPAKNSSFLLPPYMGVGMIVIDFLLHMAISLLLPLDTSDYRPGNGLLIACVLANGFVITSFAYVSANALRHTLQSKKEAPEEPSES